MKTSRISAIVATLFLCGCATQLPQPRPNLVKSVAEAGKTNIALLNIEPWSSAKKALMPKFELTSAQARELALPRTSAFEEKILEAFAAQFRIAPATSSVTSTRTRDLATGEVTGSRSETEGAGTLPGEDVIPNPLGERSVNDLPGLSDDARNAVISNNDPLLEFQVANTIYQYVQVLNRLVENTPQLDGFTPYLATFQISSFPYARHQPYDVYLDFSFFPVVHLPGESPREQSTAFLGLNEAEKIKNYRVPVVYPILVTDNLEGQTTSRAAELVRQITLAASILQGGFAGTLGLSSTNARAGSVLGTDFTSTFTVGKSSENGLTAVLGAARNPVSDYAMIRRTHNVSVLIFIPNEIVNSGTQITIAEPKTASLDRRINVIVSTDLRRPDKVSDPLPRFSSDDIFQDIVYRLQRRNLIGEAVRIPEQDSLELVRAVFGLVTTANHVGYREYMAMRFPNYQFHDTLWAEIANIIAGLPTYQTTTIPLPAPPRPAAPPKEFTVDSRQRLAAFDNQNEEAMRVVLTGVQGTVPKDLTATLTLIGPGGARYPFVATEISTGAGTLVMKFPSPISLGMSKVQRTGGRLVLSSVSGQNAFTAASFAKVAYHATPKTRTAEKTTKAASAVVTAGSDGALSVVTSAAPTPSELSKSE